METGFALVTVRAHNVSFTVTFSSYCIMVRVGLTVTNTSVKRAGRVALALDAHILELKLNNYGCRKAMESREKAGEATKSKISKFFEKSESSPRKK